MFVKENPDRKKQKKQKKTKKKTKKKQKVRRNILGGKEDWRVKLKNLIQIWGD